MANLSRWGGEGNQSSLARLHSEMDRLFSSMIDWPAWAGRGNGATQMWWPAVDVKEGENEVTVCAELPGLKPEDIDISVSGNMLTLSGERKDESEDQKRGYYVKERRVGAFSRSIELPSDADAENVTAEYRDGELIVHVPRSEAARPRKIPVSAPGREADSKPIKSTGEMPAQGRSHSGARNRDVMGSGM